MNGKAVRGSSISFGDYALKAVECGKMSARQIEAARIAINRRIKRGGQMWIRVFPAVPVTKKPAETRMGKGKGSPEGWVAKIKPGKNADLVIMSADHKVEMTVVNGKIVFCTEKYSQNEEFKLSGSLRDNVVNA